MTPFTVLIPDELRPFLDREANGNVGAYLCGLIRDVRAKASADRLESLLLEGLASEAIPFDDAFRARMDGRIEQILA
jgi:hypothetical protein